MARQYENDRWSMSYQRIVRLFVDIRMIDGKHDFLRSFRKAQSDKKYYSRWRCQVADGPKTVFISHSSEDLL